MRSSFQNSRRRVKIVSAKPYHDENYNLKGINLIAPDQVMPDGETPYTINSRRYADNLEETAVAIRTRQGSTILSSPVGEAANVSETGTVSADLELTEGVTIAIPFTASASGALTKIEEYIKKATNTRGYVMVEIRSDALGLPGALIAESSIAPNLITTSYAYVPAYFIDAPALTSGEDYWIVLKMQELGVGTYYIGQVASGGVQLSSDDGATWLAQTYGARYKTYTSTAGTIKGFAKRYPEATSNLTMFAMGTKLYTVPDSPATPSELGTNLIHADSEIVRMFTIDERTFIIDQENSIRWWDGVGAVAAVPNQPSANGVPVNGMIFENRLLTVPKNDQTRIDFTALYDFETWPAVNFLYIGRPNSPDWITAMHEFKDAATIFTKETKYTLTGTDLRTFSPVPHRGTKGAISQEATAVGKEAIYFMADDRNIYAWNGTNDILISKKIYPELRKILDLDKVRFHLYNNQLRVYYNRNPDTAVTYMLLYDIVEDQWYRDTGRPVMGSMEWVHNNNELVEFSSKCGWLFYGEQDYSDLGKPIDFKYWTAYQGYGSGAAKDRIKKFRPVVRPSNSAYYLKVGKDIDFQNRPKMRDWLVDSGGAKWGTFNWGDGTTYGGSKLLDNPTPMSGRGKFTQYRFEHRGVEQPVFLLGYIALIKSGRPR